MAFIAIACYYLIGCYSDMLFTAQDRSTFVASQMFFSDCMARPFGLMQFVGSYLTQFFYIPALGASILIAVWAATYAAGVKAFNMSSRWAPVLLLPLACLLTSIVDVGYWIYCFQIPGYWFSQSVAYLVVLLLLWGFRCTPAKWQSLWYLAAALLFPLIGWTATLMTVCMIVMQIVRRITEKRGGIVNRETAFTVIGAVIALLAPKILWCNTIFKGMYEKVVTDGGFPWFENSTASSMHQVVPFFVLIGLTILFAAFAYTNIAWDKSKVITKLHINNLIVTIPIAFAVYYAVNDNRFDNFNYLSEMRMTKAAMENDWQAIIAESKDISETTNVPSRTMVMLKNIALMNTGTLGEESFMIDSNSGNEIYNPDSLNLNTMLIASPVIYYNYGHMNYAIRWCIENAIGYGFSPFYLKSLALCATATGEKELAERYTTRLNKTQFHSDWKPQQPTKLVKALMAINNDALDQDENNCERYLIQKFCEAKGTGDSDVQEVILFYTIIARNAVDFWPAFTDYVATHQGKPLPKSFQEAYVMFEQLKPQEMPFKVDILPEIRDGYKNFMVEGQGYADQGMDKNGVASMLRNNWGGSYWWFNAFGRDVY